MNPVQISAPVRSWPGLDEVFRDTVRSEAASPKTVAFQAHVAETLRTVRGKPCILGYPISVAADYTRRLASFAKAYHHAIETIVRAWHDDDRVRKFLWTPQSLQHDIQRDANAANGRIHLCRLDLHLDSSGGFRVLETNANCPAALMSSGIAGSQWREFLSHAGVQIPDPLDHEWPEWTAQWFIENATVETGSPPDLVALVRESGGNRLELPGIAAEFARAGIDTMEIDPRHIQSKNGHANYHGRPFRHGYLKLGIQAFTRLRPDIDRFVSAVRRRMLFVQNGLHGRLIGDNKLCLAILSDPKFEYLFDASVVEAIKNHVPWSRSIAQCSAGRLRDIQRTRSTYVLKHPFDTRGRGVVIGRAIKTHAEWARYVDAAINENWVVQRFSETTELDVTPGSDFPDRHDLCLGLINGKLSGAFARSGADLRLNLARSGRMHPVFMAR